MGFDDVLGHERQCARLKAAVVGDRVHHAYLITGIPGIGRRTIARIFARALNCARQDGDACESCASCRKTLAGVHPDVLVVADDDAIPMIKVDAVRIQIIHFVGLKVMEGRYRVVIVPGVERMNLNAANALLKTLEEPPPRTVFILTTANANILLPTIRSRCQKIVLTPLPAALIADYLVTRVGMDPGRAMEVARISGGSPGRALSLNGDEIRLRTEFLGAVMDVARDGVPNLPDLVEAVLGSKGTRQDMLAMLDVLASFLRDAAMVSTAPSAPLLNPDLRDMLLELAARMTFEDIVELMALTNELKDAVRLNLGLHVILERLFIAMAQIRKTNHAE